METKFNSPALQQDLKLWLFADVEREDTRKHRTSSFSFSIRQCTSEFF